jgi:proteasome accessory factor C
VSNSALDRTARALDLIPFIVEHSGISIIDLAREFETEPQEILKDLNLLFVCGLPGYSPLELIDLSFESGYVSVIDAQSLDRPRKLTKREVISIIVGLEGLAGLRPQDDLIRVEIEQLRNRLIALVEEANLRIASYQEFQPPSPFLNLIERATATKKFLKITYLSAHRDEMTYRKINPEYLFIENGYIYLQAYCLHSKGVRTFRLDRILSAEPFDPNLYLESDIDSALSNLPSLLELSTEPILQIQAEARNFLEENSVVLEIESRTDFATVVKMKVLDPEWLIRTSLGYGDAIQILSPKSLQDLLRERAEQTLALYK